MKVNAISFPCVSMKGKYTGSNELKMLKGFVVKKLPDNISLTAYIKKKHQSLIIQLEAKSPDLIHTWEAHTVSAELSNSQNQIIDEIKTIFSRSLNKRSNNLLDEHY